MTAAPWASALALTLIAAPTATHAGAWRFDEGVLGTRMTIVVVAEAEASAHHAVAAARAEIARLNEILDHRAPSAELARLNAAGEGSASQDLLAVVQAAERWRRQTGGAFDGRLGSGQPGAVHLSSGRIGLEGGTHLSLDAIAKGYIVDRALAAARAGRVSGVAVNIGGDIGCWGSPPAGERWTIGLTDPVRPADNADCVARIDLAEGAVATSGRGPRDLIAAGRRISPTVDPATMAPVSGSISATAIAPCAADADALATAFLVMPPREAIALADRLPGVAARVTDADERIHVSARWLEVAQAAPPRPAQPAQPAMQKWPPDWAIEILYVAPDKQSVRDPDFRTPYMALWITDAQNRPIRTITMVGKDPKWQKDNFIWWGSYEERANHVIELRSEATALDGRYSLFWRGVDDNFKPIPVGDYLLHIETSQEKGKHTHRILPLKIGREPFKALLPATKEGGGLQIVYGLNP